MTEIALSTSGLNKKFGQLVVAGDISLALPRGARYALIGPNGAGKTTLINLMTGMLAPDSGKITLGNDDITAVSPDGRVKRGLVRTFQINTLFPNLTPLEAVTLAVCERRGEAGVWWKSLPSYKAAAEEAYGILSSLQLGAHCERPTKQLAYGQQRLLEIALALASKPKVVLFIEHDMEIVFRFASRIIVMVSGRILVEGTPDEIAANERVREVYLGSGHG